MRRMIMVMVLLLGLGCGTVFAGHSVTLTWTPSTDSSAAYNVYRGTTAGGEAAVPINPAPVAVACTGSSCTYTDSNVAASTTYSYYLEATLNGKSSVPSNEVSCTIPLGPPGSVSALAQ
jgi:hypothetical protein